MANNDTYSKVDKITMNERQIVIKIMKNMKAVEVDETNAELIKYAGPFCYLRFLNLINKCRQRREIPKSWKAAQFLTYLFKKKKGRLRDISLLHTAHKIS